MNINVTLLGEMITFGVLIFVTMKFIWPPITKAMDERQKKIADGLAAGARGEKNLELAQNKVKKELIAVKKDAVDIIDEANRRMAQIIDEAKAKADKEGKRILTAAQGDINKEMEAAKVEV
ncbi:MAG: F0F1 ATP synthase subunit B, partial [Gammaproteobacteria bacterium]|nr:F0F1 ATP synthase subunit B [Gammaproteobacteria bacterium]